MARELNVLALVKGNERFIFVYDDASRTQLIDSLRDQAADPNLNITWFDALVLTRKAREQAETAPIEEAVVTDRSRIDV